MKQKSEIALVATDLDGTLLRDNKTISVNDLSTLQRLQSKEIVCVAATGRSLFKVKDVLPATTPVDYVVFSSGAGIYDWKNKRLLHSEHFEKPVIDLICTHLLAHDFNFFIYRPIPDNNLFYYHQGAGHCSEFQYYLDRHKGDYMPFNQTEYPDEAGQIMAIIANDGELFESLKQEIYTACQGVKVIRTTSPVNPDYIWLEIFPETVSKGHGLLWLCDTLKIDRKRTVGIGNDYNDQDMFQFVAHPYLLSNGAEVLRQKYNQIGQSNEESGFAAVISLFDL